MPTPPPARSATGRPGAGSHASGNGRLTRREIGRNADSGARSARTARYIVWGRHCAFDAALSDGGLSADGGRLPALEAVSVSGGSQRGAWAIYAYPPPAPRAAIVNCLP